jgi:branched-chain amino acid transport system substrate-binding protein
LRKQLILASLLGLLASSALADDLVIGVAAPMTGPLAAIGDQIKTGATAAADAINAKGGVKGRNVKIQVEDDVCDPKQAVSVANRLAAAQVKFVDGHACSGSSIPASAVYADNGMLMMTPASSNPQLTEDAATNGWTTIMRLYTRDDAQGEFIGPWIAEKYAGKKIVMLHDKSAYGEGLANAVKAGMNKAGLQEVMFEGINPGEKDYSAVVTKIKSMGADLVYFGGYAPEAGLMLRQAQQIGFKLNLMMGDAIATPDFWAVAGEAAEGTMFTFPADPQARPEAKQAVEAIKKTGFQPEGFTLFSYAVVEAIAAGVERAGEDDPAKVAESLKNGEPVATAIGPVSFDEKGDIKGAQYDINVWKAGKYTKMQ